MSRLPGFHGRGAGLGERPALVVVDISVGFTDPESPLACDLEHVVDAVGLLVAAARRADVPVVYTTVAYDEEGKRRAAAFIEKVPALMTLEAGSRWVEIDPRIAPQPGEPVLRKLHASAFFETELAGDDRNADAHEANLYDIDAKYGDVVPLAETLAQLEELAVAHAPR
jgi:nicotinamidase-related amidase